MGATDYDATRFCSRCHNQTAKVHVRVHQFVIDVSCYDCHADYQLPRFYAGWPGF